MSIQEYASAKKTFEEFKRLRELLGLPLRKFIDPAQTKKDLFGTPMQDRVRVKRN